MDEDDLLRLRDVLLVDLGEDHFRWFNPDGYPGVALCVLDSIYSTGNKYSGVQRMIANYQAARCKEDGDPRSDGPSDLLDAARRWGGAQGFVERTGYRWRTSTAIGAPYKAEAALGAASVLAAADMETVTAVRLAMGDPGTQDTSPVKRDWLRLPGQRSGLTWTYFLMLAGVPGVKADRMIVRYVSRALNRVVTARDTATLVAAIADERGVARTKLDHAIWRKESGRRVYRDT